MSDFNLDDTGSDMDLDNLFTVNEDPFQIDPDDRTPIEAVLDGALAQLKDKEAQADVARIIADNALPSGYRIAANTIKQIERDLTSLYNESQKRLKDPINKIRKDAARMIKERNVDSLFGIKQDRLLELLTPKEEKTRSNLTSSDPQQNALDAMLNSIFTRDDARRKQDLEIAEADSTAQARLTEASTNELRRLTAFQDTVQYDWMRKTLELQQRSFFLQQEQLAVSKAAGLDLKAGMDAVTKNTALPDYVKSNLTEDYQEEAMNKIFGGITGRMSDFSKSFGGRLRERLQSRGGGIIDALENIVGPVSDLTGELADVGEEVSVGEIFGRVATGMGAESSAGGIGMLLRKVIRDNPTLAKFNEELMFYAENFPQELTEALESWNGGFSKDMVKRFPFLAQIRSATIADELRALIPPIEDVIIGVNQNLEGDGANMARPFDEITRRSIIEIIPGFLSRILEQQTIANYGPGAERIVYDINSEQFKSQTEAAEQALRRVQGSVGMTDRMNVLEVRNMFNNGRFVSDDVAEMLVKVSKELREEGREMNREEVLDRLLDKGEIRMIGRVNKLFDESGLGGEEIANNVRKLAMNQDVGARKELITQEVTSRINRTKLSPEALIAFEDWFTSYARLNLRPKKEKMLEDLEQLGVDPDTIAEMINFIAESKLPPRQIDRELAKGSRGVGDGFFGMQEEIRRMYEAGQKDLLDAMGVTTVNETSDNIVNDKLYGRFNRDDFMSNLDNNRFGPTRQNNDIQSQLDDRAAEQSIRPTINEPSMAAGMDFPQPSEFWNLFSTRINEVAGVPVHIMSDMSGRQPGEPMTGPSADERMYGLVERGFTVVGELLDGILRKDLTVEVQNQGIISSLINGTQNIATAGLGFMGKYTQGVFNMGSSLVGAGGNVVGGALRGGGSIIGGALGLASSPFRKNDIYVEGDTDPVITAKDLRKGRFIDVTTGNPVKSLKDITGRVEDADGNVILSEEQLETGIYDRAGNNLSALTSFVGGTFRGFADLWKWQVGTAVDLAKTVLGAPGRALGLLKRARDVYVSDDMTMPKLSALVMKNGGYMSEQGTVIRYPSDIDGEVRDRSGNIVLSHEDILKGLVFVDGTPIDANKAFQLAKKATGIAWAGVKGIWNVNKAVVGAGVDLGMGIFKGGMGAVRGIFGGGREAGRQAAIDEISRITEENGGMGGRSDQLLEGILSFMLARWPLDKESTTETMMAEQTAILQEMVNANKKASNDRDGDGDRDNSLSDILSRRSSPLNSDKAEQAIEKEEREAKDPALFGLVGGIAAALGTAVTTLGGMSQTLMGILAASKGAGLVSDILDPGVDLPEGEDNDRRRRGGRRGGRGGRFGNVASNATRANIGRRGMGRFATRAALSVGGRQLAARGGAAALAAVGGATLAPIILGASILYGAWEVGNYFWNRSEAEPIEKLRFMQYGFDPNNGDLRSLIRRTEDELEDKIVKSKESLNIKANPKWIAENLFEIWGIDPADEIAATDFLTWMRNRFIPVMSRHYAVMHGLDSGVDVRDIDDEIDEQHVVPFLNGVKTFPYIQDPMMVGIIPAMIVSRLLTKQEVENYHNGLLAKYGEGVNLTKENAEAADNMEQQAKHAAEAAGFSTATAYAKLAEERKKEALGNDNVVKVKKRYDETKVQRARDLARLQGNVYRTDANGVTTKVSTGEVVTAMGVTAASKTGKLQLIKPCNGRLTSPFGMRMVGGQQKMHKGVDWADYEGSPIVAAADGRIVRRAYSKSYGKVFYIEHANGWVSRYAHLYSMEPDIQIGDKVKQGQLIGTMGNTGNSRGVHLHFELREGFGNENKAHDPLLYIVNGSKEAEVVKKAEADAKQETKEGMGDTIEGVDTVQTTAEAKAAGPQQQVSEIDKLGQTTRKAPAKPVSPQEIDRAQRDVTNSTLNELSKVGTSQADEAVKQTGLLTNIAKNTKATAEALKMLAEELGKQKDKETGFLKQSTQSTAPTKPTSSNKSIYPIVDMSN